MFDKHELYLQYIMLPERCYKSKSHTIITKQFLERSYSVHFARLNSEDSFTENTHLPYFSQQ